ncbi:hypothetical protein EXN51_27450 [Agrobacterium fabrum]|uniref:Uncharacterized protein n=1 Tax=Agrobacterium fabrum (strain C58 / ATCC 33970) TaxID=176299 RepID=Q8UK07_AGRFC|nr:hypothetical protein Atu5317 [Agrobacterium fabrum str. C58]TRB21155.1 hypothetical protein EXN51_27450 [Agrobacterium fabrum]
MMRSCVRDWNLPGTNHAAKCIGEHLGGRLGQPSVQVVPTKHRRFRQQLIKLTSLERQEKGNARQNFSSPLDLPASLNMLLDFVHAAGVGGFTFGNRRRPDI